jgi:hypothetical protein
MLEMMLASIPSLHEPYAHLYIGDYYADTFDLDAHEHRALRLLLLETWVRGPVGHIRLATVARLTKAEWQSIKLAVLPLLRGVQPRIAESLKNIRAYDGQRLPAGDWHIVRSVVLERDGYVCTYCGSDKHLEGSCHSGAAAQMLLPISRPPAAPATSPRVPRPWKNGALIFQRRGGERLTDLSA